MLSLNDRKGRTKKSAAKDLATGYIRSGDLYGKHGISKLRERRNYYAHSSLIKDRDQLSKDWLIVGEELENAMNKYKKDLKEHE